MSVYDRGLSNHAIYVQDNVSMMYEMFSFGPAKSVVRLPPILYQVDNAVQL